MRDEEASLTNPSVMSILSCHETIVSYSRDGHTLGFISSVGYQLFQREDGLNYFYVTLK